MIYLDDILRSQIFIRIFGITRGYANTVHQIFGYGVMNYLDDILHLQIIIHIFSSGDGEIAMGHQIFGYGLMNYLDEILRLQIFIRRQGNRNGVLILRIMYIFIRLLCGTLFVFQYDSFL